MVSNLFAGAVGGASVAIVIKAVDEFSKTINSAQGKLKILEKAATITAIGIAGAFTVAAKKAAEFEQTTIAFNTLLGSTAKATKFLKELTDFAARTPFTLPGVEKAAKQLLAVGFEAEDVLPTLKSLGDVASGLGLGEEGLQRLILNLGQVRNQGKLTGRELRDFAVAGVPLLDALSESLGKSTVEIQDMISKGQVSSEDTLKAFELLTKEGGKFGNLMEKQMGSALGQISNLQDAFSIMARDIGDVLLPAVKQVVSAVSTLVNQFNKLPEGFKTATALAGLAVGGGAAVISIYAKFQGLTPANPLFVWSVNGGAGGIGSKIGAVATQVGSKALSFGSKVLPFAPVLGPAIAEAIKDPSALGSFKEDEREKLKVQFGLSEEQLDMIYKAIPQEVKKFGPIEIIEEQQNADIERAILAEQMTNNISLLTEKENELNMSRITENDVLKNYQVTVSGYQKQLAELEKQHSVGTIKEFEYWQQQSILNQRIEDAKVAAIAAAPALEKFRDEIDKMAQATGQAGGGRSQAQQLYAERGILAESESEANTFARLISEGKFGSGPYRIEKDATRVPLKVNDFILRPNGDIIETNPMDTIYGIKGGRMGEINVSIGNVYGLDADNVAEAIQEKLQTIITTA